MIINDKYGWDVLSKKKKDRDTVSKEEPWEVKDFANTHGCSEEIVKRAIDAVGNDRVDIERWIANNS